MSDFDPIYLDHNATTPVLPEVVDAMLPFLREHYGNPSSGHVYGVRAAAAVERARAQVCALLDCALDELIFTSGGTEANNMAIRGVNAGARRQVVTSVIEHPATLRPCALLEKQGYTIEHIAVTADGIVRLESAREHIGANTALVTVMHSNNETGVLQPIQELSRFAHDVGAVMHVDAAQSVGKVPVRVRELDVDLLSIAGHKLYAPKGVGALYVRRATSLTAFSVGAGHERGLRPGTENVASIVGLGLACEIVNRDLESVAARMRVYRDKLWDKLAASIPGLALNGDAEQRLPNTLNIRFPGVSGNAVLAGAPEVAASTGSACHNGHDSASAIIVAMGVPPEQARGSVRLTLGRGTTDADIERAADALVHAWNQSEKYFRRDPFDRQTRKP